MGDAHSLISGSHKQPGEWLTFKAAAKELEVSERTIRRYVSEGLPSLLGRVQRGPLREVYRSKLKNESRSQATRRSV